METRLNAAGRIASLLAGNVFAADPVLPADYFVFSHSVDSSDAVAAELVTEDQASSPAAPDAAATSIVIDSEATSISSAGPTLSNSSSTSDRFNFDSTKDSLDVGLSAANSESGFQQTNDDEATSARTSHASLADLHLDTLAADIFLPDNMPQSAPLLDANAQQELANAAASLAHLDTAHWIAPYSPVTVGGSPESLIPIGVAPDAPADEPAEVLVNGEGEIVSVLSNSSAGGSSTAGGGSTSGTASTAGGGAAASPFVINVIYDASVNNAPASFKTAVAAVVQYFESQFTDHVTINIAVGYGEVGGYTLGAGALGESLTYLSSFSYSQVKNSLAADAKTADDATAVASLPSTSPVTGTFWESTAEAKATGLLPASSSIDGYVGFASGNWFDYDNSNGVTAGQYDFFGVVAHEISEVMGRALLVGSNIGSTPHGYYPLDLFHYSANGVRDFSGSTPGYFSINGGATNLDNFNTNPGGDYGDWASSAGNDAFLAFSPSGVADAISQTDLRELDVLGWDRASSTTTPSAPSPHQRRPILSSPVFRSSERISVITSATPGPARQLRRQPAFMIPPLPTAPTP